MADTTLTSSDEVMNYDAGKFDPESVGVSGLRQFGGYINEEFLPQLSGTRAAKVYREMADNDPVVGAILFAITMLIRQVEWSVQASEDSPEGEGGKLFLEEVMDDMSTSWNAVITEICSMFVYGFAPLEIIWKQRRGPGIDPTTNSKFNDGRIGIRALSLRAQNTVRRWLFCPETDELKGMYQQPYDRGEVCIPIEKMLLFRTTEERQNPEGRSILRNAYRPWFFKKRIEEIEGVGVERDLAGLPVIYVPGSLMMQGADSTDKRTLAQYKNLVRSIRRDTHEGVVLPSARDASGNLLFELRLLSTGGSRQFDTTKIVDRYDRRIATTVLADFIFLGQGSTGSFALSSDKTELFATAVGAYTRSIAEVFNRHLIPRLWRLNGFNESTMPTLVPGDLEKPDLGVLAQFITSISGAGATLFPDRELENHLRKVAGLPLAPDDDGGYEFDGIDEGDEAGDEEEEA